MNVVCMTVRIVDTTVELHRMGELDETRQNR